MRIRVASYNLENLFTRPTALELEDDEGRQALEDHALANAIVDQPIYSKDDKATLLALDTRYRFSALNPPSNALVTLNRIRESLFRRSKDGTVTVVADGRGDWTGWFELKTTKVNWRAVENTGRVITAVKPDILVCVEVDNRPTLQRFNDQVLRAQFDHGYPHAMVIDGNDTRGIDVGILSKFPIVGIRTHVDDKREGERIFSRDCPEYVIELPAGRLLVVCPNHFKSKRGGNDPVAEARRVGQGTRAAEIAATAAQQISPLVLVAGDLNDTPDSAAVVPLLRDGWEDIQSHPNHPVERPGTYATGTKGNKIDYLIMSPELRALLVDVGIERRGSYHPNLWESFPQVDRTTEASDHHCIWADFQLD